jgi:hypothetical protein
MDLFDFYTWSQRKLVFHGLAVELSCACEEIMPQIDHLLQPFREVSFPEGFKPLRGTIEPYDIEDVMKNLSPSAVSLPAIGSACELYRDGARFYRIDESIGLTMVDLATRRWHSWLMPDALEGDLVRLTDAAVLWPLTQLARLRSIHLVPAVAAARDGFGVLMLGDLSLEPELSTLIRGGYKIIGQRWVALREEEQRIAMLHLPGHVLQKAQPRRLSAQSSVELGLGVGASRFSGTVKSTGGMAPVDQYVDLHAAHPKSLQNHAFCDLILVCGPGRREQIRAKQIGWAGALNVLRRSWPSDDLLPGQRGGKLVSKIAGSIRVAELQLSREPAELLQVLDLFRRTPVPSHLVPPTVPAVSKMMVSGWTKPAMYYAGRKTA